MEHDVGEVGVQPSHGQRGQVLPGQADHQVRDEVDDEDDGEDEEHESGAAGDLLAFPFGRLSGRLGLATSLQDVEKVSLFSMGVAVQLEPVLLLFLLSGGVEGTLRRLLSPHLHHYPTPAVAAGRGGGGRGGGGGGGGGGRRGCRPFLVSAQVEGDPGVAGDHDDGTHHQHGV